MEDTNSDILSDVFEGDAGRDIHDFINNTKGNFDVFLSALVNGYQVEKTPEEKVRDYYCTCEANWLSADERTNIAVAEHLSGQLLAINTTLDLLGIQIEGVNA